MLITLFLDVFRSFSVLEVLCCSYVYPDQESLVMIIYQAWSIPYRSGLEQGIERYYGTLSSNRSVVRALMELWDI